MKVADVLSGIPSDDSVHYFLVLGLEIGLFVAAPFALLLAAVTDQLLWLWFIPAGAALGAGRGFHRDRHLDCDRVYAYLAVHRVDPLDPTSTP